MRAQRLRRRHMPGKILGGNISGVFGGGIGTYVLLGVGAYLVIQLIK